MQFRTLSRGVNDVIEDVTYLLLRIEESGVNEKWNVTCFFPGFIWGHFQCGSTLLAFVCFLTFCYLLYTVTTINVL